MAACHLVIFWVIVGCFWKLIWRLVEDVVSVFSLTFAVYYTFLKGSYIILSIISYRHLSLYTSREYYLKKWLNFLMDWHAHKVHFDWCIYVYMHPAQNILYIYPARRCLPNSPKNLQWGDVGILFDFAYWHVSSFKFRVFDVFEWSLLLAIDFCTS